MEAGSFDATATEIPLLYTLAATGRTVLDICVFIYRYLFYLSPLMMLQSVNNDF